MSLVNDMRGFQVSVHPSLEDFELLAEVSQMLTQLDEERGLRSVINLMIKAVGAQHSSLLINPEYGEDWKRIFTKYLPTADTLEPQEMTARLAKRVIDKGLAGWVFRNHQGAVVEDTSTDARWIVLSDNPIPAGSALCVPFMWNGDVLAALTITHPDTFHFSEYHLRLFTIVVNQATGAVRNAQLFAHLLEQRQQMEAILNAIPDLLLVLDQHGMIMLANEPAAALLGTAQRPNRGAGESIANYTHNDDMLSFVSGMLENPFKTGQSWSFQTRSEKQRRDYLVTVSVWTQRGDAAGAVIILRDITNVRDLNRFKDEMLQMASHDLRSPLALIGGYCSLIALDTPDDSPVREYLNVIERSIERMRGLLDDLLRVEQIRNSPLELHRPVDYRDLIRTVIEDSYPAAASKNHRIDAVIALEDVPDEISINPLLIREAMENLINNAIKYTPDNGVICVRTHVENERLHFIVEDNGIGIPTEHLPRLFESFYRTRQTGTEHIEGRGLGLSLVKTIIERHGGEVWVESELGKGSRFGFWIPIQ
ncbi:MAG: GAF domain-containing protein [Anaerolinea sp.]|nr:GAF domain-containing protein [Anaerolinea sp.]